MDQIRRVLVRIFTPPAAGLLLLVPLSAVLLIFSLGDYGMPFFFRWVSYTLSAYTLVALCCSLHPIQHVLRALCERFPLLQRYLEDIQFHVTVGLSASQAVYLAYAALQLALYLRHRSWWYLAMTVYYFLLVLMRLGLVFYIGRNEPGSDPRREQRLMRFCGAGTLALSTILAGVIAMTILDHRFPQNNMIVEIAMAAFTFLVLGLAVYHLFSYRRYNSPALMAYVDVSLASGLVSLLNLTAAMLATFGEGTETQLIFYIRVTAASGALIYVLILLLALQMLRSTRRPRKRNPES